MMDEPTRSGRAGGIEEQSKNRFRGTAVEVDGLAMHAVVSQLPGRTQATPELVLVHGLGLSHRYMMPVAHELARDHRVWVPDQPGFGGSGHPEGVLDMVGLADALAAWMRAVELPRAVLLGNSQGCQIIAQLAARHPALVDKAVLQGPTTPPQERTWLRQFIRWRQNGRFNPPSLDPVTWGEYKMSGYSRVLRTFRLALQDRLEDQAPHIKAPTLVVRGECDPICSAAWARDLVSRLPNGSYVEIPRVAHTLCYTAPIELANVTREFLAETRPGG